MSNCGSCSGCSAGCSGCAHGGELVLNAGEIEFLQLLGQVAFLPVARQLGDLTPIYLEEGEQKQEEYSLILQCLEKKNLISLDFDRPLRGARQELYQAYPIVGSMALTQRGQQVLELLEIQGSQPEAE